MQHGFEQHRPKLQSLLSSWENANKCLYLISHIRDEVSKALDSVEHMVSSHYQQVCLLYEVDIPHKVLASPVGAVLVKNQFLYLEFTKILS